MDGSKEPGYEEHRYRLGLLTGDGIGPEIVPEADLVIVRENTEGFYTDRSAER